MLLLITDDLYDIAARLKSVNENYAVYYNVEKQRYEVHDGQRGTLEFLVPFDELDARTVEYARYSSVNNAKRLFEEVEEHNRRLEKDKATRAIERAAVAYEEGRRINEGSTIASTLR